MLSVSLIRDSWSPQQQACVLDEALSFQSGHLWAETFMQSQHRPDALRRREGLEEPLGMSRNKHINRYSLAGVSPGDQAHRSPAAPASRPPRPGMTRPFSAKDESAYDWSLPGGLVRTEEAGRYQTRLLALMSITQEPHGATSVASSFLKNKIKCTSTLQQLAF